MTKKLTIALFSASMLALSATSSFAQETYVRAGSHQNVGPTGKAVRPPPQGFREKFAAMPAVNGRGDLQIDYARPPAQPAQ
ncbi:hypothetical protein [Afipia sp. GAS231]|uniref:hypothetical protein n=1 Tax=Afipia sp. GAS231 TaxID=1882747 RepID=UPI00087D1107|nr:hypothetical protein [Afipia sp. GAS231]SDO50927.1 hypothetical protein SAMN05444050_4312 [Afipia sp. GAS231]